MTTVDYNFGETNKNASYESSNLFFRNNILYINEHYGKYDRIGSEAAFQK